MQRIPFYILLSLLFTGCSSFEPKQILTQSKEWFESTGERLDALVAPAVPVENYDDELQALFEQPYIDPLTDYLVTHSEDESRVEPLRKVSAERKMRCQKIAKIYADRALTQDNLHRYKVAYNYSCPTDVEAFAVRLAKAEAEAQSLVAASEEEQAPSVVAASEQEQVPPVEADIIDEEIVTNVNKAQLNDCYLLTTISNFREAKQVCLTPAEAGDVRSQLNMALIHNALAEYPQAMEWAKKVEQDAPRAQVLIGGLYASGHGVKQNDETGFNWFKKAAEADYADGQYMTAWCYEKGKGVSQSIQQATAWYERAAANNHVPAKHALGAILVQENDTSSTYQVGQNWLVQAAREGYAASSSLLGQLKAKQPNAADKARAVVWFELAQQQGDQAAAQRASALRQEVDQTAVNNARLEIQQLLDKPI